MDLSQRMKFIKMMEEQINQTTDQLGFFSVSKIYAFLVMIKKRKKKKTARESNAFCAAIPKDLLKSFDCICHYLLIAKLNPYGFDWNALKLIYDCLRGRSQKTKVGSSFSAYSDIIHGVPQEFILGPLLFNIFVICFLRTIFLTLETLLMIPLLTNVDLHLIKSWITLK